MALQSAQVALAEMMVNGRGGPASPAEARELFEKAAAKGHAGAMFALGAMYGRGHNMPMDRQAALRWFRAAAELGHGHAQARSLSRKRCRGRAKPKRGIPAARPSRRAGHPRS